MEKTEFETKGRGRGRGRKEGRSFLPFLLMFLLFFVGSAGFGTVQYVKKGWRKADHRKVEGWGSLSSLSFCGAESEYSFLLR